MVNFKEETLIQIIKAEIKRAIVKQIDFVDTHKIKIGQLVVEVDRTRNPKFGDYSSNVAMSFNLNTEETLEIANLIAKSLPETIFKNVTVVKPGFVNMTMNHEFSTQIIKEICHAKDAYGKFKPKKTFYNIEFVSANPTGLLHIGHARNAAIGDSLVRV
jgi:arginyl-tRNA synthetase